MKPSNFYIYIYERPFPSVCTGLLLYSYKIMKQFLSRMEWPSFVKALLWGLLVFLQFHHHRGCLHEERIALLQLKAFLKSNIIIYAHHRLLPSWIDDAKSTDCCGWERVTCNSTTAHVINLSLDNLNQDPITMNIMRTITIIISMEIKNIRMLRSMLRRVIGC
jgi:hypothetical protein